MNNLPGDFMGKNVRKYDKEDLGGVGDIQCCVLQRIYVGS